MKLLQDKVKSLKSRLFQKKDFEWYLNFIVISIKHPLKTSLNYDNSTQLKSALDVIKTEKKVNVSIFLIACFVSFFCAWGSFKLLLLLFEYSYGNDGILVLVKTLLLAFIFLTLSLASLIIPYIKLLNFRDFNELENRLNSLLRKKEIESFSTEEIETHLRIRVSDWVKLDMSMNEILNNLDYRDFIKKPLLFSRTVQLMKDHPELKDEQCNRIGSYVFRCYVVDIPVEYTSQRQKVEFWMKINGGRGALGSLILIDKPYYSKNKANNAKAIENLIEIKKLFNSIEVEDFDDKIEEDLSLITKRPK